MRRFAELLQVDVDVSELEQAADEYSEQVSEAVSSDADTASYVEELERRVDMLSAEENLPSGDTLAAELTRFLRERDEEEDEGTRGRKARPPSLRGYSEVPSPWPSPGTVGLRSASLLS